MVRSGEYQSFLVFIICSNHISICMRLMMVYTNFVLQSNTFTCERRSLFKATSPLSNYQQCNDVWAMMFEQTFPKWLPKCNFFFNQRKINRICLLFANCQCFLNWESTLVSSLPALEKVFLLVKEDEPCLRRLLLAPSTTRAFIEQRWGWWGWLWPLLSTTRYPIPA